MSCVFFLSVGDSYRILTQISYIPTGLRRLLKDWTCGPWILSLVPCTVCWNKGLHRCLSWRPRTSPSTLYIRKFATLSLCFRADFAHFFPTELDMSPLLHSDVYFFVTCDKQVKLSKKCIHPKEPSACIPSIISVIPCKECDASTFLNYPCLMYDLFKKRRKKKITLHVTGRGRHWVIQQVWRFKCCLLGFRSLNSLQVDGMVEIA